ncbi:DeoR/GlpR transcriptional regulator [Gemella sp. GH3]|uniref:DeoR/GlpR family DNA-binding transcription regulator n=1 Tax=unclassified Gemella TaxID=2624949 RepID=UPI0015D04AD2|nr:MULTISPECIES: DeoR/GlpR family DNA-binding transcription regulator [unclassified Gemella]MBF0714071.1 DeoR/GlpR transcriptional regulator [Gemella sp. GH3.1]NYS51023.1 DeoR/GlpR transcriptional regulator [Gemella sp. GH3]
MKSKRIDEMEEYIHINKKVSLSELEDKFQVSMNTIRRDIKVLLEKDVITKVYGGVESKKDIYLNKDDVLIDIETRNTINKEEKVSIAKEAARYINNGDTIYIDSGTTTSAILNYLDRDISLTIVTNSVSVLNKAIKFPNVEIIISGNAYRKRTNSFVKIGNYSILDRVNVVKAFMAATSVSVANGAMNATLEEYELKSKIITKAREKYLLVDSTKFNKTGFITFAVLTDFKMIITDKLVDGDFKKFLALKNIDLIETKN